MGAKVSALSGSVIADEIINFAKQKNVTLIIAGLSHRSRIEEIFKGTVLNELVRKSGSINVLIVGNDGYKKIPYERHISVGKIDYRPYLLSLLGILLTIGISLFLSFWLEPVGIGMLLLIPAIASGVIWGIKVGLFSSLIAVAAFDYFFIPPYLTFRVSDVKYFPIFVVFIAVSLVISFLAKLVRWQAASARHRERFLSSLYSFNREIMMADTLEDILIRAVKYISEAFESNVVILLSDENDSLEMRTELDKNLLLDQKEKAVADWVYKNAQHAGRGTSTLSSSRWYYMPLNIKDKIIGVIGLSPIQQDIKYSPEQNRLFNLFPTL